MAALRIAPLYFIGSAIQYLVLFIVKFAFLQLMSCQVHQPEEEKDSLLTAIKKNNLNRVKECLKERQNADEKDPLDTILLAYACYYDHTGTIVQSLLDQGAKINVKDEYGRLPLDWAINSFYGFNIPAIKCIIQKAIERRDIQIISENGQSLLHLALQLQYDKKDKKEDKVSIIQLVKGLLALSPDLNLKDRFGFTPLHYAAGNQDVDLAVVDMLLAAGALPDIKDNFGYTPLNYVPTTREDILLKFLLVNQ